MTLQVVDLFAGIGGFSLAAERAGFEIVAQVEIDEWCRRVLAKHWPDIPRYGDIREVTGDEFGPVDLLCGGPPCQPVSLAGKGLGADDERWLWPDTLRLVGDIRPRWVVLENPTGLFGRGMGDILGVLAQLGYDAEWQVISAAAVGAWHLRRRIWIVAYPNRDEYQVSSHAQQRTPAPIVFTDPDSIRRFRWTGQLRTAGWGEPANGDSSPADAYSFGVQGNGATGVRLTSASAQTRLPGRSDSGDGSNFWSAEPDVVRVAYGVPNGVERLRGLGNAIVPQVAEYIFQRIANYEREAA